MLYSFSVDFHGIGPMLAIWFAYYHEYHGIIKHSLDTPGGGILLQLSRSVYLHAKEVRKQEQAWLHNRLPASIHHLFPEKI